MRLYVGERAPDANYREAVSRDLTLFNQGTDLPGSQYQAISREVSIYNNL